MIVQIEKIDPVHCRVSPKDRSILLPCLAFDYTTWKVTDEGRRYPVDRKRFFIDSQGYFLTGLLPRIKFYLKKRGVDIEYTGRIFRLKYDRLIPKIAGKKLRDDQVSAIGNILERQRGVVHFPTGSGKTLIAAAVLPCFHKRRVLFLCHTIDILNQSAKRFEEYDIKGKMSMLGGGKKMSGDFFKADICLATIQSFSKIPAEKYVDAFDIVVVDEVHHVSSLNTLYGKVLMRMLAPVRIGLTATLPEKRESMLTVEGLFGPVIARLNQDEAVEKKILAEINLNLVPVPYSAKTGHETSYKKIYKAGIVSNRARNRLIVESVADMIDRGKTSLVMVREIEHGEALHRMSRLFGLSGVVFLQGKDDSEVREKVAGALQKKKIRCVIATAIWKEGIDIPSLDHVVNAFGGKGEIPTIQVPGRGSRTDEGKKDSVAVTDFLDPYRYLAEHCVRRIQIYRERGWI